MPFASSSATFFPKDPIMSNHSSRLGGRWAVSLAVLAVLVAGVADAEVSVDGFGEAVSTVVLGSVVDDPNPIGIWLKVRTTDKALNIDGDLRGDQPPDIAWMASSWPVVVWAYNSGSDFDVAYSEWDGTDWTTIEFLTSAVENERDPSVFVETDGQVHVAWGTQSKKIYLVTRQAESPVWDAPILITTGSEAGWQPSVAFFDGNLFVAYASYSATAGMAQDIKVAIRQPAGGFTVDVVASTTLTNPPDVKLHVNQGRLWIDWQHDVGELGCAGYLPGVGWIDNPPEPWVDASWIGIEETRKAIRRRILVVE